MWYLIVSIPDLCILTYFLYSITSCIAYFDTSYQVIVSFLYSHHLTLPYIFYYKTMACFFLVYPKYVYQIPNSHEKEFCYLHKYLNTNKLGVVLYQNSRTMQFVLVINFKMPIIWHFKIHYQNMCSCMSSMKGVLYPRAHYFISIGAIWFSFVTAEYCFSRARSMRVVTLSINSSPVAQW